MRTGVRRLCLALLLVLPGIATAGAIASACVPQPLLAIQPSASGPPGTKVTVTGFSFNAPTAEVRWNAIDGPLLASATSSDFTAEMTVPQAPAGLYTVIGIARQAGGGIAGTAAVSFQVTAGSGGAPDASGAATAPTAKPDEGRADGPDSGTAPAPSGGVSGTTAVLGAAAVFLAGAVGGLLLSRTRRRPQTAAS